MNDKPITIDQEIIFHRLIDALDKRYERLQTGLCDAINHLYAIVETADEVGDPRGDALNSILSTLAVASVEGNLLQGDVTDILFNQLLQSHSAKQAYEQGWQNRLIDLLAHATPEQVAILRQIVLNELD